MFLSREPRIKAITSGSLLTLKIKIIKVHFKTECWFKIKMRYLSYRIMRSSSLVILFFALFIFSGCSTPKFVETNLYFGLSKDDGTIIQDTAWNTFVENNIAVTFYKGFTVLTTEGRWLDEKSGKIYAEPSHMVISVNKMDHQLSLHIDNLRNAYKKMFQQQSVLRVDKKAKISF